MFVVDGGVVGGDQCHFLSAAAINLMGTRFDGKLYFTIDWPGASNESTTVIVLHYMACGHAFVYLQAEPN